MADDIIPLRHSYALSMVERISELEAEVERMTEHNRELATGYVELLDHHTATRLERDRLRAAGEYVDGLGVDWCVLHHGVRNEDSDRCDAFDWDDGDDMLDEDGEYLPCDLRPLAYREARRG